ncbi:MAG: hypothetical protein ACPLX7_10485, partial [Candidatus Kapaibacteriota bacterium]
MFGNGEETRGLKLSRLTRSFAEDGVKINSVVEIEYYETQKKVGTEWVPMYSEAEAKTLKALKNEGFIGIWLDT